MIFSHQLQYFASVTCAMTSAAVFLVVKPVSNLRKSSFLLEDRPRASYFWTAILFSLIPTCSWLKYVVFPPRGATCCSTEIIPTQMDLMESTLFNPPVILLQTVLEEVRHRSLPLYNRLRALVKSDDKRIWVFYNEFHS